MAKNTRSEEHATDAEIEAAIAALSEADLLRLDKVAGFRARMLVGLGLGTGAKDLLQDAITRTIAGERRWRKKVSFVKHLIETMKSIANHARDELKGDVASTANTDGPLSDRVDGVAIAARIPGALDVTAINEQFRNIMKRFADDDEVVLVLECLADGMKGPEIQRDLNLTEQ